MTPALARAARCAVAAALALSGLSLLAAPSARAQEPGTQGSGTQALVDVIEVDGVIDRTVAAYVRDTIAKANRDGAQLVALSLDTPGGLGVPLDELVAAVTSSEVPVLAYVGPAGAQASGAGAVLAAAAHVTAMSPVTRLGPAVPADLGVPDTAAQVEATAATLADLARLRDRNPEFAEAAARDEQVLAILAPGATPGDVPADIRSASPNLVALTAEEAVDAGYVDLVEPTLSGALDAVAGREVTVEGPGGESRSRTIAVDERNANVRFNNLGLLRRLLHTVANPTLAYLLVMAGALAVAFELFQPGFGVAGISGALLGALGLYGLSVLPTNGLALALVFVGLALLAVDLALAGLGALTAAGTIALAVGSFTLFGGPPVLRVSPWVLGGVVAFTVVFFVVIMTTVLRAQGNQALTGAERLVGQTGVVRSMLNPEGHVFIAGALWRARAPEAAGRVRTGTPVRVTGLDDALTLEVELVDSDAPVR
jgi:membrane-bound serine protease (ClpP class)